MLRERRSIAELEELLAERLTLLRAGELGSTAFSAPRAVEEDRLTSAPADQHAPDLVRGGSCVSRVHVSQVHVHVKTVLNTRFPWSVPVFT